MVPGIDRACAPQSFNAWFQMFHLFIIRSFINLTEDLGLKSIKEIYLERWKGGGGLCAATFEPGWLMGLSSAPNHLANNTTTTTISKYLNEFIHGTE